MRAHIFSEGSRRDHSENTLLGVGNHPVLEKIEHRQALLSELNSFYGILGTAALTAIDRVCHVRGVCDLHAGLFRKIGRREIPWLGDTRSYWSTGRSVSCHTIYPWVTINNQHTNIINGRSEGIKKKRAIDYVKFWTLMRAHACCLLLYPRYQYKAAAVGIVGPAYRTPHRERTNYISIHIIRWRIANRT